MNALDMLGSVRKVTYSLLCVWMLDSEDRQSKNSYFELSAYQYEYEKN
jgi:hypothetical protein